MILSLFTEWAPLLVEQRSHYLNRGQDFLVLDPLYEEGGTWLSIRRKFDLKNLVRLYKSDEFVLYRWSRPLESGTQ